MSGTTGADAGGRFAVPVVDISGWSGGTAAGRALIAADVDRAARTVGFLQIRGHGIPDGVVRDFAAALDAFFALPLEEKKRLRPPSPGVTADTPRRAPSNSA
ncbi:2-oxoglutarate and iron-dependent oxygenase domain-containing protein [Streptomyces lydicus]|uniref:2-oxoglutarate and iron-dependent oxygenase domain-containing protein n=1 Tax=Streptomyces lydicus TaxID=47763 RepID=UPI002E3535C0|nr:2-oxoglutarate and iron-dependent oxygenase domain-containing protein [Streptomyces lydicus]